MSCFSCFSSHEKKAAKRRNNDRPKARQLPTAPPPQKEPSAAPQLRPENPKPKPQPEATNNNWELQKEAGNNNNNNNIAAQTFTFRELATATRNFRHECLIGEGGFGRVYKGRLEKTGQIVAVKQLDRNGLQGNREFLVEAEPVFKDPSRYPELADPLLQGDFPIRGLNQAVAVAAMCLHEEASVRPLISDVVTALSFLGSGPEATAAILPCGITEQNINAAANSAAPEEDSAKERQRAVAEAMEWGSHSRMASQCGSASSL
ncbi:serine/threonine-protein kinase [Tripterygium wilfordii]|uniref:Serine/threonine-protein kinase n=1 Tax=Tripterygium wilfordii TaxID=458696 RepID=A0A7J7D4H5_TRIWF|nr:serine/threonine-protein kinase [Tripterygium wilfordii]